MNKFWSGGFLFNPDTQSVLLHKRDNNTLYNPNMWAFFGGLSENNETPEECFIREFKEEINTDIKLDNLIPLCNYLNTEFNTHRYVFYVESNIDLDQLTLGEGADFAWVTLVEADKLALTEKTVRDLKTFREKLK